MKSTKRKLKERKVEKREKEKEKLKISLGSLSLLIQRSFRENHNRSRVSRGVNFTTLFPRVVAIKSPVQPEVDEGRGVHS